MRLAEIRSIGARIASASCVAQEVVEGRRTARASRRDRVARAPVASRPGSDPVPSPATFRRGGTSQVPLDQEHVAGMDDAERAVRKRRRSAPVSSRPSNRPSRLAGGKRRCRAGWAAASQAARTGASPSPRQRASQRGEGGGEASRGRRRVGRAPASAARLVAGRSRSSGWWARLTPKPTITASPCRSSRMPASLAPSTSRSLGHLIRAAGA